MKDASRALRELRRRSPKTAVVALSARCDRRNVREVLKGGAVSYLSKSSSPQEITAAIRRAACGISTFSPGAPAEVARDLARQMEVVEDEEREQALTYRIRDALSAGQPAVVFQPVVDLETGEAVGFEALARFRVEPEQSPNVWFEEAATVGLLTDLELASVQIALGQIDRLPASAFLSVNVSPQAINSRRLQQTLVGASSERIVVELSERALVPRPEGLQWSLRWLRARGIRVCLDDAGAGLSTLRQIAELRPDFIKLCMALAREIDEDKTCQAVTSLIRRCAVQTGTVLISKGIETEAELSSLLALGVRFGQGFHLGSPQPLEPALGGSRRQVRAGPAHGGPRPRAVDGASSRRPVGHGRGSVPWHAEATTGLEGG
jgi:EAL domain-containing protein (putative c-di-GMP-specific phosphodiesterase class I)